MFNNKSNTRAVFHSTRLSTSIGPSEGRKLRCGMKPVRGGHGQLINQVEEQLYEECIVRLEQA